MTPWEWLAEPPVSTIFILGLSTLYSLLISLIRRVFTPKDQLKQLNAWRREITAWQSDFNRAKRAGDKKLLKKLRKKERRIKQLQSKVSSQMLDSFKTMPIFMVLFILIWTGLTGTLMIPFFTSSPIPLFETPFNDLQRPVAYLPWLAGIRPLKLFEWYFLCSLVSGIILSRVLGPEMGATE